MHKNLVKFAALWFSRHFDAFWMHFTPTVIVTMMFMTSTVTFLNCIMLNSAAKR